MSFSQNLGPWPCWKLGKWDVEVNFKVISVSQSSVKSSDMMCMSPALEKLWLRQIF